LSLIERLGEDYKNLPVILAEYEKGLEEVEANIAIKGKNLEAANAEHSSWYYYYESRRAELSTLEKFFDAKTAAARGRLFKKFTETYNRDLSDRQKEHYINNEEAYLKQNEVYLEIREIYKKYEAVCEAYKSRGFKLNNITKIRVASLEHVDI